MMPSPTWLKNSSNAIVMQHCIVSSLLGSILFGMICFLQLESIIEMRISIAFVLLITADRVQANLIKVVGCGLVLGCMKYLTNVELKAQQEVLLNKLNRIIDQVGYPHQPAKIIKLGKQIINGWKYTVWFTTKDKLRCMVKWLERPWISHRGEFVEFRKCKSMKYSLGTA